MPGSEISAAEALYLVELAEVAARGRTLPELAATFLPDLVKLLQIPAAVLFLPDPHLPANSFFQTGLHSEAIPAVRSQCAAQFHPEPGLSNLQAVPVTLYSAAPAQLMRSFPCRTPIRLWGLWAWRCPRPDPPPPGPC